MMTEPYFLFPNHSASTQVRPKLTTLLPPSPGQTRQSSYSAHPDFAPPPLPRPRLLTDNLPLDPVNRPKSASTRLSPSAAIWAENRKRFYTTLSTVTSFASFNSAHQASPNTSANPMDWSWHQAQSVAFAPANIQYPNSDEKRAFESGSNGYLGLQPQQSFAPQSYYQGMPYRPSLAVDTTAQNTFAPQINTSHSPAPPSVIETASDGERITTPGMQFSFPTYTSNYAYSLDPTNDATDLSQWTPQFTPQYYPDFTHSSHQSSFDAQSQGTISPSQLGHSQLNFENLRNKSFSDLMQSRGSFSSEASSTDGEPNGLDDWQKLHRMLPVTKDHLTASPVHGTLPDPTRRSDAQWSMPRTSKSAFDISGITASVPNPEALDDALRGYITAPNRLAYGERKIIVMSPKVGQKSYGTEKRFLCPHPQAVLVGSSWWHTSSDGCPTQTRLPPRVNISLEGENPVKDAICSWTTTDGQNLDEKINTQTLKATETPFIGNVAGKNLHISDTDSKRREARALVTVKAPLAHHAGAHGWGPAKGTMQNITNDETVGIFPSKEIKIISKPSKKKANAKSSELLVQHGTTVAIFNRVKSQTTSTRYLSVTPDPTRILGSDGKSVTGAVPPPGPTHRTTFPGFTASASIWESFIIWLADPKLAPGPGIHPPLHPGWPVAPANAMFAPHFSPPIRYNNTIILQSLQTGICSPVLIIRRVEQDAEVVGGDGSSNDILNCLPDGEMGGDLVSQLQKVAFEVYNPEQQYMAPQESKWGGVWLSCDQEAVQDKVVHAEKRWSPVPVPTSGRTSRPSSTPSTPSQRYGVLPMTPHTNLAHLPGTPSLPGSPNSTTSSLDYFGSHSRKTSSASLASHGDSNHDLLTPTSEGGPVRRQRTGSASSRGPLSRPANRKRTSGEVPTISSYEYLSSAHTSPTDNHRMCWTMNVGDVCIWTIVSTEQNTYTFYVPQYVKETSEPYAPMPSITRLLPPAAAIDAGPNAGITFTSRTTKPLITLYGKGFQKKTDASPRHLIYYDAEPAEYNEARCDEVMAATEPPIPLGRPANIYLVRDDGECIIPTHLSYP